MIDLRLFRNPVFSINLTTAVLMFQNIDPYFALFNFWSSELALGGVIVLAVTLAASLVVERPFCKYACPYGAVLGIFNLFRIFGIRRNPPTCTNCKLCDRACPMNIQVSTKPGRVLDHQCISCLECTSEKACPEKDTVIFGIGAPPAVEAAPAKEAVK